MSYVFPQWSAKKIVLTSVFLSQLYQFLSYPKKEFAILQLTLYQINVILHSQNIGLLTSKNVNKRKI